ncbi:hypothetical protein NQ318_004463 [Aromia moschata]|uniref:Uncharacterized protein n=1 Tax=Aromia moschata TaxID=1265417 RepID=A0AAV8YB66_9CUCU|nr:hypothetical protein NQ318_004463 [Aromia moschata]
MLNIPMQNYQQSLLQRPIVNTNGDMPSVSYITRKEPIIIRGDGNITVPDEYKYTVYKVNKVLRKKLSYNIKLLFCACLCFCCTLGLSTCPSLALNRITKNEISEILEKENKRIYNQLGLHWSLVKQHFGPVPIIEYVLQIDFVGKPKLFVPD